jgi:uncharacterized membrane protein
MRRRDRNLWLLAAAAGGVAYPFLVYFGRAYSGMSFLQPPLLMAIALVLIGLRLLAMRGADGRPWLVGMAIAALVLLLLLAWNAGLAVMAYPVVISLTVAGIFGGSLLWPPSIVERFARRREPDLPPVAIAYMRGVTQVWFLFLLSNAAVAAALGLWGSLQLWTLWTGLVSYLLMGALFLGELAWRRFVRARA